MPPCAWMNSSLCTNMPPRAAAGIVDAALVRLDHLDQQPDDAARRVELAALLALCAGELAEEVLVDAAEDVLGAVLCAAEADGADQVDQLAEPLLCRAPGGRSPWAGRP